MQLYTWKWTIEQLDACKNGFYNLGQAASQVKKLTLQNGIFSLFFDCDRRILEGVTPPSSSKSVLSMIGTGLLCIICFPLLVLDRCLLWPLTQVAYGILYVAFTSIGIGVSLILALLSVIGIPFEWSVDKIIDISRFFLSVPICSSEESPMPVAQSFLETSSPLSPSFQKDSNWGFAFSVARTPGQARVSPCSSPTDNTSEETGTSESTNSSSSQRTAPIPFPWLCSFKDVVSLQKKLEPSQSVSLEKKMV